jgi:hypothetical protein
VLRDAGFATVRPEGARRLCAVNADPLREVDAWLDHFRRFWTPKLDALATELARGRRERRRRESSDSNDLRAAGRRHEPGGDQTDKGRNS